MGVSLSLRESIVLILCQCLDFYRTVGNKNKTTHKNKETRYPFMLESFWCDLVASRVSVQVEKA